MIGSSISRQRICKFDMSSTTAFPKVTIGENRDGLFDRFHGRSSNSDQSFDLNVLDDIAVADCLCRHVKLPVNTRFPAELRGGWAGLARCWSKMHAAMADNSEEEAHVVASEGETEDTEASVSSVSLPCRKTLGAWAKSRFEQWRLHTEQQSSEPLTWELQQSKFSAAQIIAWFAFKDKKYHETIQASIPSNDSCILGAESADPSTNRQMFGCSKRYHRDPDFISIFKQPQARLTGKKRNRYTNELWEFVAFYFALPNFR